MKSLILIGAIAWAGIWLTPDQQGRQHFRSGEYVEAAKAFSDPMWQGAAWYRAGEFEKAAQVFARRDSAEAFYNQGNAWLMHGNYGEAARCYEKALARRPDWAEAAENRALAEARAKLVEAKGGNMGGDQGEKEDMNADNTVFHQGAKPGDADSEQVVAEGAGNEQIQAMWLRRVQTRPADFLRAKFAYQVSAREEPK